MHEKPPRTTLAYAAALIHQGVVYSNGLSA